MVCIDSSVSSRVSCFVGNCNIFTLKNVAFRALHRLQSYQKMVCIQSYEDDMRVKAVNCHFRKQILLKSDGDARAADEISYLPKAEAMRLSVKSLRMQRGSQTE